MRVLLTGTEGSGVEQVGRLLHAAGHEVVSCTPNDEFERRCAGMVEGSECPAASGVDVIVAARLHPLPHLTKHERFIDCPLLEHVPLVVAGSTIINPYGRRADILVEGFDGVEDACLDAMAKHGRAPRIPIVL